MVYLDDRMLLLVTGLVAFSSLAACLWRYWFYFRQLVRFCSCKKAVKKYDAIPEYWENAGKSLNGALDRSSPDYFDDIYPVPLQNREVLQRFLNETSTNEEIHFQLVRAVRVEHSRLWSEYQSLAQEIGRQKLSFKGHGGPTTNQALESVESWGGWYGGFVHALDEDICEAYLFHGTEPHSALKIVEGGFHVKNASRAGKRFGIGGYFSEDPAVADKYAGEGEGLYKGCHAMLLCRVILGAQYCTKMFRKGSSRSCPEWMSFHPGRTPWYFTPGICGAGWQSNLPGICVGL